MKKTGRMVELLESQEFYELMQAYRHAAVEDQDEVVKAFNNIKVWILANL